MKGKGKKRGKIKEKRPSKTITQEASILKSIQVQLEHTLCIVVKRIPFVNIGDHVYFYFFLCLLSLSFLLLLIAPSLLFCSYRQTTSFFFILPFPSSALFFLFFLSSSFLSPSLFCVCAMFRVYDWLVSLFLFSMVTILYYHIYLAAIKQGFVPAKI